MVLKPIQPDHCRKRAAVLSVVAAGTTIGVYELPGVHPVVQTVETLIVVFVSLFEFAIR